MLAHRPRTTGRRSLLAVATLLALLGLGLPHPPWWTPTPPPGGLWAALGSAGTAHAQTTPPPPTPTPAPPTPTRVSGAIVTDTTWTKSASPYLVTGRITVYATLTIQAGVKVRFARFGELRVGEFVAATLVAVGTEAEPILFTADAASPTAGAWESITLYRKTTTATRIENVVIEGARIGLRLLRVSHEITLRSSTVRLVRNYGVYIASTSPPPTLDGWDISEVGDAAVQLAGSGFGPQSFLLRNTTLRGAFAAPAVTSATLENNTFHGTFDTPKATSLTLKDNIFHENFDAPAATNITVQKSTFNKSFNVSAATNATFENNIFRGGFHAPVLWTAVFTNNTINNYGSWIARVTANLVADVAASIPDATAQTVIEVNGGILSHSASWPARIYRITKSFEVTGTAAPILSLAPGTTLRFAAGADLTIGREATGLAAAAIAPQNTSGGLVAVGAATAPIRFTADAAKPTAGAWGSIYLQSGTLATSKLENVIVEFAPTALHLNSITSKVTLRAGTIRHVRRGIYALNSAPILDSWTVSKAGDEALRVILAGKAIYSLTLRNSQIHGLFVVAPNPNIIPNVAIINVVIENNIFRGEFHVGDLHSAEIRKNIFHDRFVVAAVTTGSLTNNTFRGGFSVPQLAKRFFENNTIANYGSWTARVHPSMVPDVAANIPGATAQTVIEVIGSTLEKSANWPARTYRIFGRLTVTGTSSPILTLAEGATLRFAKNRSEAGSLVIGLGGLVAVGTAAAPILFTADAETPKAGAWEGITFHLGTNTISQLTKVIIEYPVQGIRLQSVPSGWSLGSGVVRHTSREGIYNTGGSPTLSHWTISSTGSHGLVSSHGSPDLSHLRISGAGGDGIYLIDFSGRLEQNTITGSGDDGVECASLNPFLTVSLSRPVISDNRITGSTGSGLACGCSAQVERNTITGNGVGVELVVAPLLLAIHHNDLSGNTVPMKSTATAGADARRNWWGSATGPSSIVGKVRTNPWLGAAPTAPFRIEGAMASPERFAPGGSASTATVTARAPQAATWSLTLRNGAGTTVRSFTGTGTSFTQAGDGRNTASQALPAGSYRYTLSARPSAAGGTAAAPVLGDLTLVAGDLVAEIATPGQGARLTKAASLVVRGRALGTGFSAYELSYAAGAAPAVTTFVQIARVTTAVATVTTLGTWNTSQLNGGVYTLRLRTLGNGNAAVEERVTVALLEFGSVTVLPNLFSPNGDGRREVAFASAKATAHGDWTAQVRSASGIVVREYSGTGSVPRIIWDGRNTAGVTQADGTYTLALRMAVETGKLVEATGTVTLDVTPPQAIITVPAMNTAILNYTDLTITGTASDTHFASYELRVVGGAETVTLLGNGTEAVVAGTLGKLADTATVPRYENGSPYTLELSVQDRAENRITVTRALRFDRIHLSGLAAVPQTIDPERDETVRISYRLSRAATVTVQLVPERTGGPTLTLVENRSTLPSLLTTTWNGKNAAGKPLARGLYHLRITARDDAGRSAVYDASEATSSKFAPEWSNVSVNHSTVFGYRIPGGAVRSSTYPKVLVPVKFDPYRNDELWIDYQMSEMARHSIEVRLGPLHLFEQRILLRDRVPVLKGDNRAIWTGRLASGKQYTGPFSIYFGGPEPISDLSVVVWSPEFRVEKFRANPYVFQPAHAQVVHISYALQSAAKVQVDIVDPDGNHWLRLQEATVQQPGTHQLEWSGRNAKEEVAASQGLYTIEVTATQTSGRKERTVRRGNLLVYP